MSVVELFPLTCVEHAQRVSRLNSELDAIKASAVDKAFELGDALTLAKAEAPIAARWKAWLKDCGVDYVQATKYMKLAKDPTLRVLQTNPISLTKPGMSYGTIFELMYAPEQLKDDIVQRANDGEVFTQAQVRAAVKEAKAEAAKESAVSLGFINKKLKDEMQKAAGLQEKLEEKLDPTDTPQYQALLRRLETEQKIAKDARTGAVDARKLYETQVAALEAKMLSMNNSATPPTQAELKEIQREKIRLTNQENAIKTQVDAADGLKAKVAELEQQLKDTTFKMKVAQQAAEAKPEPELVTDARQLRLAVIDAQLRYYQEAIEHAQDQIMVLSKERAELTKK